MMKACGFEGLAPPLDYREAGQQAAVNSPCQNTPARFTFSSFVLHCSLKVSWFVKAHLI